MQDQYGRTISSVTKADGSVTYSTNDGVSITVKPLHDPNAILSTFNSFMPEGYQPPD
jgi:hypothetical protein